MERNNERTNLTRRNFLKTAGFTGLVATSASLVGCGGTSSTGSTDSGASVTKTLNVAAQTAVMLNDVVGDAFAPRNPYALDIDFEQEPPRFVVNEHHWAATWLLDPRAPKVEMPSQLKRRIALMRAEGGGEGD